MSVRAKVLASRIALRIERHRELGKALGIEAAGKKPPPS